MVLYILIFSVGFFLAPRILMLNAVGGFFIAMLQYCDTFSFMVCVLMLICEIICTVLRLRSPLAALAAAVLVLEALSLQSERAEDGGRARALTVPMLPSKASKGPRDTRPVEAEDISKMYERLREIGEQLPLDMWHMLLSMSGCPFSGSTAGTPRDAAPGKPGDARPPLGLLEAGASAVTPLCTHESLEFASALSNGAHQSLQAPDAQLARPRPAPGANGAAAADQADPLGTRLAQVSALLENLSCWNFDIFALDVLIPGRPLFVVVFSIFERHALLERLDIERQAFAEFLTRLENKHNQNPYHSNIHAADVTQALYSLLSVSGFMDILSPLEFFAITCAAAGHDVDHPGAGNNLLEAVNFPLSMMYAGQAPAERHSLTVLLDLLWHCDVLKAWTKAEKSSLRLILTDLVLSTDMTQHGQIVQDLEKIISTQKCEFLTGTSCGLWDSKLQIMAAFIHIADLSNTFRPLPLYIHWVERLSDEICLQRDIETSLHEADAPPPTEHGKPRIVESQRDFSKYLILPLLDRLIALFPTLRQMRPGAVNNPLIWSHVPELVERTSILAQSLPEEFKCYETYIRGLRVQKGRATEALIQLQREEKLCPAWIDELAGADEASDHSAR